MKFKETKSLWINYFFFTAAEGTDVCVLDWIGMPATIICGYHWEFIWLFCLELIRQDQNGHHRGFVEGVLWYHDFNHAVWKAWFHSLVIDIQEFWLNSLVQIAQMWVP